MTEDNRTSTDDQGAQNQESQIESEGDATHEMTREEELLAQLGGLENDLDDAKDKFLRAHAEMENMRRRMERERSDLLKYGFEGLYKDMLPVLDSFEKALPDQPAGQISDDLRAHLEGMMLIKNQLFTVMQKHGLEPIESKQKTFDPNVHQAIQRLESADVDDEVVGDEFARGYLLNGRLLRPAMVSVIVPKKSD